MDTNQLSRRSLFAAPAIVKTAQSSSTLRVAFVGVGNRGSFLLKNMLDVEGVQIVGIADIVEERARAAAAAVEAKGGKARVWTDFRKMLDQDKSIDAVVLTTPDFTHKDFDIAILEMGKHLYAEKPLALTAADCRAVVTAAKQAKGIMQVGFQLRHDPKRNAAMKHIKAGGIGQVLMCHGIRHGGDLPRNIPWYFDKTKCGDIVVDQGIHILDLFRWAVGAPPLRCYGSGGIKLFVNEPPGRTVMDHYSLILEYPGDVKVNFSHNYFDPPGFTGIQERVFGSEGALDLANAAFHPRSQRGRVELPVPDAGKDSTFMALSAFAESVRTGAKPLNNPASAMESTVQALMATRSIYEKRVVTWEEMAQG
ncbi:MAG TPA: Gfo/Idh/MocA family oxidoreductase [Bryobacteraceae bacterium]|nr:Gfo/Idh/MocA family oxidoreductase [Bryobacteraceae bacterium]